MDQQPIVPSLWFNRNAQKAVEFYTSVFPGGQIGHIEHYPQSPEQGLADFQAGFAGQVLSIEFSLSGHQFLAINSDDTFHPNPSISFFVNVDPSTDNQGRQHLDELWTALLTHGRILMPLDQYPFSPYYGWVEDQYGVSWQLMLNSPEGEPRPKIMPSLLFTLDNANRAEEAMQFYTSVFDDSKLGIISRYPQPTGPAKQGAVAYGDFQVLGQWLAAMDSGVEHNFTFSEGISLIVHCRDQAEIDRYWQALSVDPQAEQCGWCKDKFGVSWQILPANMNQLLAKPGAFDKMMKMKKIVIADLET